MREIVLDTETTGLDPRSGHRLVEIGCVELVNHFPSERIFHVYMNPQRSMPDAAFRVHGLSDDFLADKPLFADLADDFLEFIDGARLVIHNARFDLGFLNYELEELGKSLISWDYVIDTLALARAKFPGAQNSLDALCRRFDIDNSAREKHGALLDSELLAEVYIELTGGHQANLLFGREDGQKEQASEQVISAQQSPQKARPTPLPARLTKAEKEAHSDFIENDIKDALWKRFS